VTDESAVRAALDTVIDPEIRRPITELDMVDHITVTDASIDVGIALTIVGCPASDRIDADVTQAVTAVAEGRTVSVTLGVMDQARRQALISRLRGEKTMPFGPGTLTRIIAVTSGKGGVGKSTVTANLAAIAAMRGFQTGIIDADVFGFSIPGLLGIEGATPTRIDDMMLPPIGHDIKAISIGMFVPPHQPVSWRGPMLHRTLTQFLTDVHFGDLDFLFIDLPPGTGDIAISLGQTLPHSEVLVVTTPQVAAADVAERSGLVAQQVGQKIIGVVETMSAGTLPDGTTLDLFGQGGGKEVATRLDVPLLGSVPLSVALREGGDTGTPVCLSHPTDPATLVLEQIADTLIRSGHSRVGIPLPLSPL
jgi:ATP-binding protein involved in chromosome partitioning